MKRNHVYESSSFYSDTFPLILVFYGAFIKEYTCFLLISDGSIPILSIDTIGHAGYRKHRSIGENFFFFDRQYRSSVRKKKNFSPIKSNHRLKIFFSSKDHRSNRCFLQLIDYRYRSNRCFFRHRCPPMVTSNLPSLFGCCK